MAYQMFTWCPRIDPTGTHSFRVLSAQFGDGYKQSVGDGINNEVQTWPLQFTGDAAYINGIVSFLRAHRGYLPFQWTPPLGELGLYEAGEFSVTPHGGGKYTLAVTFEQRFAP